MPKQDTYPEDCENPRIIGEGERLVRYCPQSRLLKAMGAANKNANRCGELILICNHCGKGRA